MKKSSSTLVEAPVAEERSESSSGPQNRRKGSSGRKGNGHVNGRGDGNSQAPASAKTRTGSSSARSEEKRDARRPEGDSMEMDAREILRALIALKKGDFSVRMP